MIARILLLIALLILAADIATKFFVDAYMPLGYAYAGFPFGGIPVFHNFFGIDFSINHMINRGAAWGIFGEYQDLLTIGRIFIIGGMLIYLLFFNQNRSLRIPLTLILTGATGNIIDYFVYGHVVDMFHFVLWGYDFPVFNVADSAVTLGVAWWIVLSICQELQLKKIRAS